MSFASFITFPDPMLPLFMLLHWWKKVNIFLSRVQLDTESIFTVWPVIKMCLWVRVTTSQLTLVHRVLGYFEHPSSVSCKGFEKQVSSKIKMFIYNSSVDFSFITQYVFVCKQLKNCYETYYILFGWLVVSLSLPSYFQVNLIHVYIKFCHVSVLNCRTIVLMTR